MIEARGNLGVIHNQPHSISEYTLFHLHKVIELGSREIFVPNKFHFQINIFFCGYRAIMSNN